MITASIVLYKTPQNQIDSVLEAIAQSKKIQKLYIIDNSPSDTNESFFKTCLISSIIVYIPHENTGYGSSHNIAIRKACDCGADYHIILNPDISFSSDVLEKLEIFMDDNKDVSYVLPKVIYPDGTIQYLCKLLPTPFDLIFRRFLPKFEILKKHNEKYELRHSGYNKIINPPCLSGCFMFLRVSTIKVNNLFFDNRFFMYCEDFDLIRRIHSVARTVYYPEVTIIHNHAKESYKNKKMLRIHIKSAIQYFNKWGWFFDKERIVMNRRILKEIEVLK